MFRQHWTITCLLNIGVLFILISALSGCGGSTPTPVPTPEAIAAVVAQEINILLNPDITEVPVGGQVAISVETTGENLKIDWGADKGQLSRTEGPSVIYTAPDTPGLDTVDITVTRGNESTPRTVTFTVFAPPTETSTPTEEPTMTPTSTVEVSSTPVGPPHDQPCDNFTSPVVVIRPRLNAGELTGTITAPEHCKIGLPAASPLSVGGIASEVPEGAYLWLLVYARNARYYPQCDDAAKGLCGANYANGRWAVMTWLGQEGCKEPFHLVLVAVDSGGNDFLTETLMSWAAARHFPGLTVGELPEGITELDSIEVETAGQFCE